MVISMASAELLFLTHFSNRNVPKYFYFTPMMLTSLSQNVDFRCLAEIFHCILHVWSLKEVSL